MSTVKRTKQNLSKRRVECFTESVIREMSRRALLHGAVNLSQGFPDFPAPEEVKCAAQDAIARDIINMESVGREEFAAGDAHKWQEWHGIFC